MTNFGSPIIEIESSNFQNKSELHLLHIFQGVELDMQYAAETTKNLQKIWKRPVNIKTLQGGKEMTFVHDGKNFKALI